MKIILFICLIIIVYPFKLQAFIIKVGKGERCSSIKQALSDAQSGDTIYILPGLYQEGNIIVDKPVSLIGKDFPILDGQHKFEVLSVKSSNVFISGLHIRHSGMSSVQDLSGIKLYDVKNVHIKGNRLTDNFFAVYLQYSKHCIVEKNIITAHAVIEQQSGNGIHVWKSDSVLLKDNLIKGHRDGIYLEFATNSVIKRNIVQQNLRYGLHFMFSHKNHYINNVFEDNGAGVAVMYSRNVEMRYNVFSNNWGDAAFGLLLKEITDSGIEFNSFDNNTTGIYLDGASRVLIDNNDFLYNGWAMKMMANCMDVTISNCNFIANTFEISTNGSLVLNKLVGNYWDKYEGYDLDKDGVGDVPYRPVSLFSRIIEQNPTAMILMKSFMVVLLDRTEKMIPTIIPENLIDHSPSIQKKEN
jgi:nitrous oxidase accessory protein